MSSPPSDPVPDEVESCPICGSTEILEIQCKVVCKNCRTIIKSCADLGS